MSWGEKNGIPLLRVPLVQNFLTQVTFMHPALSGGLPRDCNTVDWVWS